MEDCCVDPPPKFPNKPPPGFDCADEPPRLPNMPPVVPEVAAGAGVVVDEAGVDVLPLRRVRRSVSY